MIVLKHIVSIARNDGRLPFNPFAGDINSPESVSAETQQDVVVFSSAQKDLAVRKALVVRADNLTSKVGILGCKSK